LFVFSDFTRSFINFCISFIDLEIVFSDFAWSFINLCLLFIDLWIVFSDFTRSFINLCLLFIDLWIVFSDYALSFINFCLSFVDLPILFTILYKQPIKYLQQTVKTISGMCFLGSMISIMIWKNYNAAKIWKFGNLKFNRTWIQ